MITKTAATIRDLESVPENVKAEIIHGEIVIMAPTGGLPGRISSEIYLSLRDYERHTQRGYAFPDNVGFIVNLPHRQSFSPDAAFGLQEPTMKFIEGAPIFAVEVRSDGDYGPAAEAAMAQKRADYFSAGTQVVWDVNLLSDEVVSVYRANSPDEVTIYRRGDIAEAEPALPDWSMPVDDLFR